MRGSSASERREADTESRAFLQERLTLFGRWFFVISAGYYLVANLPSDAVLGYPFDWWNEWFGTSELFELGIVASACVLWLATRGRGLSHRALVLLDAFGVIAPLLLLGASLLPDIPLPGEEYEIAIMLLPAIHIVIVRAIIVPSRPRRTMRLSAIAFLPVVVATTVAAARTTSLPSRTIVHLSIGAAMWAAVAVTCATIASRILFHLRDDIANVKKLGQYTLQYKIGEGATGIVYRGHHALLRRPTALKLLAPSRHSEADLRRFEREVQLTAELTHPNTVAIYDYGRTPEGLFYYAMEYVDGVSFEELVLRDGPQPPWRVIHLLRQACGALAEAHRLGLIHRDIKPANLMLCVRGGTPDVVKVVDFGLVKPIHDGGAGVSATGDIAGTPLYMSPEIIETPSSVDERCDLYSLAATAYYLLCARPVFTGASVVVICSKHLSEPPVPPSDRLGRPLPDDLEALIMACLAKKPADRPASASDLEARLARCADAAGWSAERVAPWWEEQRQKPMSTPVSAEGETIELVPRKSSAGRHAV